MQSYKHRAFRLIWPWDNTQRGCIPEDITYCRLPTVPQSPWALRLLWEVWCRDQYLSLWSSYLVFKFFYCWLALVVYLHFTVRGGEAQAGGGKSGLPLPNLIFVIYDVGNKYQVLPLPNSPDFCICHLPFDAAATGKAAKKRVAVAKSEKQMTLSCLCRIVFVAPQVLTKRKVSKEATPPTPWWPFNCPTIWALD